MASGLRAQAQRFRSGERDVACEAIEKVEHSLAPGGERLIGCEHFLRAHDARPLERRKEDVVGIRGFCASDKGLTLERGLHRRKYLRERGERAVASGTRTLERHAEKLLHRSAKVRLIGRIDTLMNVCGYEAQHRRHDRAIDPTVERLRNTAADLAAEERRLLAITCFEVLGDLPGVAHHRIAVTDHRHRFAAGEGDRLLVGQANRHGFELEALVAQRHSRAPREKAIAPAVLALQFPELDHAAFLTSEGLSLTSWLAGRARKRRSI